MVTTHVCPNTGKVIAGLFVPVENHDNPQHENRYWEASRVDRKAQIRPAGGQGELF